MAILRELQLVSGSGDSNGIISADAVKGIWSVDLTDNSSVQFRVPSSSFGGTTDRIPFYYSSSGRIGINNW